MGLFTSPGPELVFESSCSPTPWGWGFFSIPALPTMAMDLHFTSLPGPGPSRFPDSCTEGNGLHFYSCLCSSVSFPESYGGNVSFPFPSGKQLLLVLGTRPTVGTEEVSCPFPLVQFLLPTFSQPETSLASLLFPKMVNFCINPKDWRVSSWSHCSSKFHMRQGLEEVARFHSCVPCPSV